MDGLVSAQGAVDSLLGTLATVIKDEANLLWGVHGDVQFIMDEMESMNGFLLVVSDAACEDDDHQVRAWTKQVRDVAKASEQWVREYQQLVGAIPRANGDGGCCSRLLVYVRRLSYLVSTAKKRHDIASRIQELKARAHDIGERRQRYGVSLPPASNNSKKQPQLDRPAVGEEMEEQRYLRRRLLEDPCNEPDITEEKLAETIMFYVDSAVALAEGTKRTHDSGMADAVRGIFSKLAQDLFCSKMLVHLLYVNRTLEQLQVLWGSLSQDGGRKNTRQMLLFCYNDLPNSYRRCLLYLSVFPSVGATGGLHC